MSKLSTSDIDTLSLVKAIEVVVETGVLDGEELDEGFQEEFENPSNVLAMWYGDDEDGTASLLMDIMNLAEMGYIKTGLERDDLMCEDTEEVIWNLAHAEINLSDKGKDALIDYYMNHVEDSESEASDKKYISMFIKIFKDHQGQIINFFNGVAQGVVATCITNMMFR